jgi:hypothetical protein
MTVSPIMTQPITNPPITITTHLTRVSREE